MKAIVIAIAALFLLASPAMAGQCPTLIKQLNESVDKTKDEAKAKQAKVLIADAQKFHDSKQHADAIAKCDDAAKVLGVELKKK
jgi:ABC-type transporter MlaC component